VFDDRHQMVGLLFAGSHLQTLVNPIALVLSELSAAAATAGIAGLQAITA
jgi:hypothetical protein